MMIPMSFIMTSLAELRKSEKDLPFSPARQAPIPTRMEKMIRASMFFFEMISGKSDAVRARTIPVGRVDRLQVESLAEIDLDA